MKGYKAFDSDFTCHNGFKYEVGKTYELGPGEELEICKCGFHFCENLIDVYGYYKNDLDTRVAEVEALGDIQQEGTKFVTNKIKILREVSLDEIVDLIDKARSNVGNYNTGRRNTGFRNSGNENSGDCNSGDWNTGSRNAGDHNTGNSNTGSRNAGDRNIGDWNTGFNNYGDGNVGNHNTGVGNVGSYNSGNNNVGYFNSCSYRVGCFNTKVPTVWLFNKDSGIPADRFYGNLKYLFMLQRIHSRTLTDNDVKLIKSLPNFDPDIFYETTGININEL